MIHHDDEEASITRKNASHEFCNMKLVLSSDRVGRNGIIESGNEVYIGILAEIRARRPPHMCVDDLRGWQARWLVGCRQIC